MVFDVTPLGQQCADQEPPYQAMAGADEQSHTCISGAVVAFWIMMRRHASPNETQQSVDYRSHS